MMGSVFKADCPRCGTRGVAFTLVDEKMTANIDLVNHGIFKWDTTARCGHCDCGVIAAFVFQGSGGDSPNARLTGRPREEIVPDQIFPEPPDHNAPAYTPDPARDYFRQGMDSLQANNFDAGGMVFRKALEVALKSKFGSNDGKLYDCIEKAVGNGGLTADMGEWAHEIRSLGNEAAHQPFSQEEAQSLADFTRLVFMYLFTLPGMMQKARRETGNDGKGKQVATRE